MEFFNTTNKEQIKQMIKERQAEGKEFEGVIMPNPSIYTQMALSDLAKEVGKLKCSERKKKKIYCSALELVQWARLDVYYKGCEVVRDDDKEGGQDNDNH